jgi:hypothetical protein
MKKFSKAKVKKVLSKSKKGVSTAKSIGQAGITEGKLFISRLIQMTEKQRVEIKKIVRAEVKREVSRLKKKVVGKAKKTVKKTAKNFRK